jgi:hypothetical protein
MLVPIGISTIFMLCLFTAVHCFTVFLPVTRTVPLKFFSPVFTVNSARAAVKSTAYGERPY